MGRLSFLLIGAAVLGGCSGAESTLPTSSLGSEKSVRPSLSAGAVSGIVKNALDGQPVGGITVEIPGVASVTTGGDGAFTLEGAGASGCLSFCAATHFTREKLTCCPRRSARRSTFFR